MSDVNQSKPYKVSYFPTVLSMGNYAIRLMGKYEENTSYEVPDDASLFLADGIADRSEWNMLCFIIPRKEFAEPEGKPLAGFEEGPVPYRIYKEDSGNYLWVRKDKDKNNHLVYRISKNWRIWELLFDHTGGGSPDFFMELAYIFPYSVLNKQGIMFHGVVMEWKTMGIIVCAHSGVGKTTHTEQWKTGEGAHILNGDRALCYRKKEQWYTCGAPWNGSSLECLNQNVELRTIVILEQSETNQVVKLTGRQAALELISLTFAPAWDQELMNMALDLIDGITREITVLKLRCRPDYEAVTLLKRELIRTDHKQRNGMKYEST